MTEFKNKTLHGKYAAALESPEVDRCLSTRYLVEGYLRTETESFIAAIQDQVIATNNYRRYILKQNIPDDRCRMCTATAESIQHLSSGCTYLAPRDYLDRHNKVAGIIHQELCNTYGLIDTKTQYYKYVPEVIMENDDVKIYWDTDIITDRMVRHNRLGIVVLKKKDKAMYIVDITIPLDENIRNSRTEKIAKYQDLANEM